MTKFITFEGIEGSGKSTQIRLLEAYLVAEGHRVVVTREPGGCAIADAIRRILLDSRHTQLVPTAELLLYAAARAQHVAEVILPALERGCIVLCDRFSDATLAYQGAGRQLDCELITTLSRLASNGLEPDLTLLLDLPVAEGLGRARQRNAVSSSFDEGRFEAESLAFHERVRTGYLNLAASTSRIRIVDATGEPQTIARRLVTVVAPLLDAAP